MENKRIKAAFVVLHYKAVEDTKECIKSILENVDARDVHIIVVDNHSPDNSGKVLCNEYKDNNFVTVIKNEKNLGFSNGNNIGYKYAKYTLNAEYIILCNNDILLFQKNFIKKLDEEFNNSKFAVLGPMVLTKDGRYTSSPSRITPLDKDQVENLLKYYLWCYRFNKVHLLKMYYLWRKLIGKKSVKTFNRYYQKQYDVSIHGCFMAFSRIYIDSFDGLNENTFMYGEEEILYKTILNYKMKSVYTPEIIVYHKEDASTDSVHKSNHSKKEFYYKNMVKSTKVLLELYK
ncbi:glycosyltransferase [Faecalicoccus pleomorphus]|uniref:glycosyltransferase n=1 Tax=Faecalicoccus pleomorphus TaxID=1323 RepID=UPI0039F4F904